MTDHPLDPDQKFVLVVLALFALLVLFIGVTNP